MAATSIPGFASRSELKRKRRDDGYESDSKKRNFSQLPIRSPPVTRPSISITRPFSYSGPQGLLTPDSVSEEGNRPDDVWSQTSQPQRSHSSSDTSCSSNSSSSLRVHVDNDENMDMEISSPKLVRIGRARSNDIMSPVRDRSSNLLSPPILSSEERIPTPVASTFGARNPYEAALASSRAVPSRTTLTPMLTEESWTPQMHQQEHVQHDHQPPFSPDPDPDAMMIVEDASNELDALSVNCSHDHQTNDPMSGSPTRQSRKRHGLGLDGAMTDASGRTARLHMGFRSDCEKCVQRVPGHYSHIMWS